ncbi:TetR/AcrR family transcriptional regulator [Arthrobacter sp. AOP36-A1-22]|uniref:TetR/AcrR family transcriptional regulator n=1 Tax=Arthrobacter sp. AOP36-A1-22 TaxID=3457684 RepID=UPI004034590B
MDRTKASNPAGLSTAWSSNDLTSKARIRNAALTLFAQQGEDGTSMRAIATAAGVTVGLVTHHYGTKDGLREAVDTLVVELFADTLAALPNEGGPRRVLGLRDEAVAGMLHANPTIVDYLRRSLLHGPGRPADILSRLAALTAEQTRVLRDAGVVSTDRSVTEQTVTTIVRQLGRQLLQPLANRIVDEFGEPGENAPELYVGVKS